MSSVIANASRAFVCAAIAFAAVRLAEAQPGGPPTAVQVCPVTLDEIPPSIRLVGTVIPDRRVTVASEVSGIVARMLVRDGQSVAAGEPLCELDPQPFQLRLNEARAALAALESRLLEARNGPRAEEMMRREAAVAEMGAMVRKWDFERGRLKKLQASGQTSEKEVYDAEMEFLAAERRTSQAQAALDEGRNGTRPEILAALAAEVEAQRSRVAMAERDATRGTIRAPFAGDVIFRQTETGAWLAAGGPVCDMIALDPILIRADVPESAIAHCKPGSPVTLEIEALAARRTGTLARVIAQGVVSAHTFPVEIELPNADRALLPGMLAWTYVPSGPPGKRLMVSKDALVVDGPSRKIYVVRPAGPKSEMAIPTNVICGLERDGKIEVQAEGLAEGDRVVCRANERLFGPTPVMAMPFDPSQRGPLSNKAGDGPARGREGAAAPAAAPNGAPPPKPEKVDASAASQPTAGSQ
ncbi:MAG: efflux RND transporter periplasmic adaptor subunit [Phycisphaerae bacterium]|nr:efflux RND transporter periplasmic adaptor subunit [Phycisphaerae bacterium]